MTEKEEKKKLVNKICIVWLNIDFIDQIKFYMVRFNWMEKKSSAKIQFENELERECNCMIKWAIHTAYKQTNQFCMKTSI